MKIKLHEIPEEGMDLQVKVADDVWFREILQDAFREDYPHGNKGELNLHLFRTGENVQVTGAADVSLMPSCDRCLEKFARDVEVPLTVNLIPKYSNNEQVAEDEDESFSFYQGEVIDLNNIIREIMVLEIPIRYLCSENCKGLCVQCGQNLNTTPCSCRPASNDPRFAVLKNWGK